MTNVTVRGGAGASGTGPVSVNSEIGDLAVMFIADQWSSSRVQAPEGWETGWRGDIGNRAGVVATRRVKSPSDTQDIRAVNPNDRGARIRMVVVVLAGVESFTVHPWTFPAAQHEGLVLRATQQHGANTNTAQYVPGSTRGGQASTTAGWSMVQAWLGDAHGFTGAGGDAPAAYGYVSLVPVEDEPEPVERAPKTAAVSLGDGSPIVATVRGGPVSFQVMPRGKSVAEIMAKKSLTVIAHRGGSRDYPECSMHAYTQSVAHGAHALEVPTTKTKDGVWVVAHDETLQRVDPSAPAKPIKEMTWSEVQRFRTYGERILRVEEVVEAYGHTHTLLLDPKYSIHSWRELMELADKDYAVLKSAGDAGWVGQPARDAGYTTWGYMYPQHIDDGRYRTWSTYWAITGLDYRATPAQWAALAEVSSNLIAHIVPTLDDLNGVTAHTRLMGVMASGVESITERYRHAYAGPLA